MLKESPLAIALATIVISLAAGWALGYSMASKQRGMCKSYDVEATHQTVEICTRITK